MKTILRWPGSKWRIADWIIHQFPQHDVYCEPFFGSGAVFFRKNPSGTETINDIDGNVVNLFRVIRDSADELAKAIEMTPYSREEYRECQEIKGDEIEQARRFLVRTWQAFGGKTYSPAASWAHDRTNTVFRPRYWCQLPDRLLDTVERLRMAQIECMDALELIPMYNRDNTLLYIDPPYLRSSRTQLHYECEFAKTDEHMALLQLCREHKGPCIISSYENDLYNEELAGWSKRSITTQTNCAGTAVEVIYLNAACTREMNLFA